MVNGEWIGVCVVALIATQAPRANARVVLLPPRHRNWQAERMPTGHWVASLWVALREVPKTGKMETQQPLRSTELRPSALHRDQIVHIC